MRLTSIKLSGFKSFVDPTTVPFPSNLVAIVGPNGSGKSNIIDAVRWVMGESAAKYLRGESITDVIFNGSTARKPVAQAVIELLFDNTSGRLTGEYAAYNQIAVKRLLSRDGQSTYFLNGHRCRRKDITDLFMGTGLGPRSYAIIMQDTISRLIEAKPEELRIYLEEAAGISKYKERRRETQARIEQTRENLLRLSDLRNELNKQLSHLERQAKAAERYKILKEEQRQIKAQLYAHKALLINNELSEVTLKIHSAENIIQNTLARSEAMDASFSKEQAQEMIASDNFNEIQTRYFKLTADIARNEQSKQHYVQQQKNLSTEHQKEIQVLDQAQQNLSEDESQILKLEQQLQNFLPQLQKAKDNLLEVEENLNRNEIIQHEWQNEWDSFNQKSAKTMQEAEVSQTKLRHIEQDQQSLEKQLIELNKEKQSYDLEEKASGLIKVNEELAQVLQTVSNLQQQEETIKQEIRQFEERLKGLNQELHQQRSTYQQLQGKLASLESLQQIALGQKDQTVNHWLEQKQLHKNSRVAEILKIDNQWEIALEIVLSGYLEAICVPDMAIFMEKTEELNLNFVQTHAYANLQLPHSLTLAHKVEGSTTIQNFLSTIYLADDEAEAIKMLPKLASYESIITPKGFWLGHGWLKQKVIKDEKAGVLRRQQELRTLEKDLTLIKQKLSEIEKELQENSQGLTLKKENLSQLQITLRSKISAQNQLEASLQIKEKEIKQINLRMTQVIETILKLESKIQDLQKEYQQTRIIWQEALCKTEHDQIKKEELLSQRDHLKENTTCARRALQEMREIFQKLELQYHTAKTERDSCLKAIERTKSQVISLQERCKQIQEQLTNIKLPLLTVEEELQKHLEQQVLVQEELKNAKERVVTIANNLKDIEKQKQQITKELDTLKTDLANLRLHDQTLEVKKEAIHEHLSELNLHYDQIVKELPTCLNEEEYERKLEELTHKITRLEPVNLAAIDECTLLAERKNYLDAQDTDLMDALNTLENAIRKIDKETKERFEETYTKVNNHFQNLFPKVFVGGSAYLELTGDDLLETGVNVIARPPGKRNSTIHLLSGGEKALTALALVFSLFQLNPAPFCMLDEVDAPLDDANINRFCSLVKEMSKTVQFIFISHNKMAIEMADQLTGVTMIEPGVSRLVAVDMAKAIELAGLEDKIKEKVEIMI